MSPSPSIRFEHRIIDQDSPENPHIKTSADISGDGLTDLAVASSAGGPLVWYRASDWSKHVIAPSGKWSTDARLVDMDGDGDMDLLISAGRDENRLEWYENPLPDGDPAAGPWKQHVIGFPRAHDVMTGDVDGDGEMEIVTRTQGKGGDHFLIRKQRNGDWTQHRVDCPAGEGLAITDLTGNGRLDVIVGARWYEAPEDVYRDAWEEHLIADWPTDTVVALADMNGNGRLDVLLTRSEGCHRLSWFETPADPRSVPWPEHLVDDSVDFAHSLAVCDLTGDGKPDIVTAEMHQSERKRVLVYLNGGDSLKWHRQVVAETGMHKLCVGPTSRDGRVDIMGANWSGDYHPMELWKNLGPA